MKKIFFIILLASIASAKAVAQSEKKPFLYSNRFSILAGMVQPLVLSGGNIEINYFTRRISFDYSHGFSLDPPVVGDYKDQNLVLHLPYSTGFGVGYRFTSFLDLRFEPKLHSWEVYNKGESQTGGNKIAHFKSFTLGLGLYYRYFPFRNSESKLLQGITTSTSIRWWQNVGTTLRKDEFTYLSKVTGKDETVKAPNIGISNSPIVFNIAVGYTFGGK
jgi:hypothetical protein